VGTGRLEAFSDGVLAIVITIMVLELRIPHESGAHALRTLVPVFLTYALSFVNIGIYWNNHHHLLRATDHVTGRVLWANLHLLFWLSLLPFFTGWMGENHFAKLPTSAYGVVLLLAALAYPGASADHREGPRVRLKIGRSDRHRREGQALPRSLRSRHSIGLRESLDTSRLLRGRGTDLADPGSPHRDVHRMTAAVDEIG
jgi:hypothetical protein